MNLLEKISKGQQVGLNINYEYQGETFWLQMAIQLYKGEYLAHITVIDEKNMAGEDFKLYKTTAHANIDEALAFLKSNSPVSFSFSDFKPFKGQRAFYPEGEEIARQ